MKVNIDLTVCRICLQNGDDEMSSIFDKDDCNVLISKKIESCGGIKIVKNYELPTKICKKCNAFLSIAHKFRTICQNSDDYLAEFIAKGKVRKIKPAKRISANKCQASKQHFENVSSKIDLDNKEANESNYSYHTHLELKTSKNNLESVSPKIDIDKKDDNDSDYSYGGGKDNGGFSDEDSDADQKLDIKPLKTLSMGEDGTAVIKNKKQTHICEICGNTYERRYCLEAHMRRHRNEKPFECEICKKAFALNFQLTRHMRSHTGDRPYKCQYCDRSFADRSTNVKHERIHTNERPYKCETCGKCFTYSNVLKVHIMTHTGERPFTCELCGKKFAQLHHLRAHLQTLQHQHDSQAASLLLKSEPLTE